MARSAARKPAHQLAIQSLAPSIDETLEDRRREKRIDEIVAKYKAAAKFGNIAGCTKLWEELKVEVGNRSPLQVRRMEEKLGLRR